MRSWELKGKSLWFHTALIFTCGYSEGCSEDNFSLPLSLACRVHFRGMTINVPQLLLQSSLSSLFCQHLPVMCIIGMKLATSPPVTCGLKKIQSSWSCDQGFLCLVAGKQGSTWVIMFLVMSIYTT